MTSNPPGIDCGVDCSETYAVGTVVTLTVRADVYSKFKVWSGPCTSTAGCVVTMDASKIVTATFSLKPRILLPLIQRRILSTFHLATIQPIVAPRRALRSRCSCRPVDGMRAECGGEE